MKIKTVRKWSEEANPKTVDIIAGILLAIMMGCYVYMGYLFTLL
jgi:hypothetical protein